MPNLTNMRIFIRIRYKAWKYEDQEMYANSGVNQKGFPDRSTLTVAKPAP